MNTSTTSDKDSRRERGKIAQREYRKRHASTFHNLKEENQALKDSIRHLTAVAATTHPRQLSPDLGAAIDRLREVAGLADQYGPVAPAAAAAAASVSGVGAGQSTDASHLDMLFPVSDSSGGGVSPAGSGPAVLPSTVGMGSDTLVAMTGPMHDPNFGFQLPMDHHHHPQHHGHHAAHHQPQHHQQHHHAPLPSLPPPSARASEPMYFGHDMFTFAGRLFWDCMTYNFIRTQRLHAGTITRSEQVPGQDAYTMAEEDQDLMAAMARTRLQYREPMPDYLYPGPGYLSHHHPHQAHHSAAYSHHPQHAHQMAATRTAGGFPINVELAENYTLGRCAKVPGSMSDEQLSHWWKTPAGVEAFIRERMPADEYRRTVEDVLTGRDMSVEGEASIRVAMQALVPNAIYFPDGPRWNIMYLSMVVGTWLRELKGGNMSLPG